jgi:protein-tyrosine-phosphatase
MIEAAAERRYDLAPHRGVQVSSGLLAWADLVLAMDRANLAALRDLADEDTLPKLALYLDDDEVPDPWGKPVCVFREGVRIIEDGVLRHLSAS